MARLSIVLLALPLAVLLPAGACAKRDWPNRLTVEAKAPVSQIQPPQSLDVTYPCGDGMVCDLRQFMQRTRTCALYVVKDATPMLHMTDDSKDCKEGNAKHRYGLASVTKSITAILFGRLAGDAKFGPALGLDTPVSEALRPLGLDFRGQATLRDLLHMSSGIVRNEYDEAEQAFIRVEADEKGTQVSDYRTLLEGAGKRLKRARFERKLAFNYSSFDSQLIGAIVEHRLNAAGEPKLRTLADAASKWLWTDLGMSTNAEWKADFERHPPAYCCFYTRPEDLARFGQSVLDGYGRGDGSSNAMDRWMRQSVADSVELPSEYKRRCPAQGSIKPERYGYQWWILSGKGNGFTAYGDLGQILHVMPEFNMVVVQFSEFDRSRENLSACESYLVHRRIAEKLAR